ncbi:septal ring lytic transglycosylase RlpA family protein [Sphingobium sp. MK2]|uniref:septal ring lytic transglycosylase RlpA family protein n=1 Tax=Sphingobium sp. MK2 TaxID=3116540 RepID=UPI0032E35D28
MRSSNRIGGQCLAAGALLLLAACAGEPPAAPPNTLARPPVQRTPLVADEPVIVGASYTIGGVTYTPEDEPQYDAVGYAGWYGEEVEGNKTANGEAFMPMAITAAHKTLPLPSCVEVTALDTGKTILVRLNDRGPFANDRLIDLSRGAAEQLGILGEGAAPVRVRRVNPPEQDRALLRAHQRAAERLETPASLLTPLRAKLPAPILTASAPEAATPRPAPSPRPSPPTTIRGGYVVQVGAFASRDRAEALAKRIGATAVESGNLWRVRFGPYSTRTAAQAGVRAAAAGGFENAPIIANDAR